MGTRACVPSLHIDDDSCSNRASLFAASALTHASDHRELAALGSNLGPGQDAVEVARSEKERALFARACAQLKGAKTHSGRARAGDRRRAKSRRRRRRRRGRRRPNRTTSSHLAVRTSARICCLCDTVPKVSVCFSWFSLKSPVLLLSCCSCRRNNRCQPAMRCLEIERERLHARA